MGSDIHRKQQAKSLAQGSIRVRVRGEHVQRRKHSETGGHGVMNPRAQRARVPLQHGRHVATRRWGHLCHQTSRGRSQCEHDEYGTVYGKKPEDNWEMELTVRTMPADLPM